MVVTPTYSTTAQPILQLHLQQRFPARSVSLIDRYILHKLGEQDLEPAPTAEPALLLGD